MKKSITDPDPDTNDTDPDSVPVPGKSFIKDTHIPCFVCVYTT